MVLFRVIKTLFRFITLPLRLLLRPFRRPLGRFALRIQLDLGGAAARRRHEAYRVAGLLLQEFNRLGFTKRTAGTKKKRSVVQRVRWESPLLLAGEELWCPVDLRRLPLGVTTNDLRAEDVIQSLEDRVHLAVRADYLANGKFCFVVRLGGSKFPDSISINNFALAPDAPPLAIPLGVDSAGDQRVIDLAEIKHLIVAGATGGGKTTFQHAAIQTLISRNTTDELELWLIDLKGTEFSLYKPLMGSKGQPGIVRHLATEPPAAVEVLDLAYKEIRRRNELMERYAATSLVDLAQLTGQRLKRIVLLFDEISIMTLDTSKVGKQTIGSWGTFLMAKIAALGRSAGVHILIGTQMINKEVLSGLIRANFETRLCFSTADWRQSQLVVESSEADGLPVGRGIYRHGGRTSEVQTPLITAKQVRLEVSRIAEYGPDGGLGDREELTRFVKDALLLLATACEHLQGDFAREKLLALDGVRRVISQARFHEVAQRLERDGVLEPGGPRKPRRVSRGFYGRPGLLVSLYGLQGAEIDANRSQTVDRPMSQPFADSPAQFTQPDAEKLPAPALGDTVYSLESDATCAPTGAEETEPPVLEPEIGERWLRAIDAADAKSKKKKRNS